MLVWIKEKNNKIGHWDITAERLYRKAVEFQGEMHFILLNIVCYNTDSYSQRKGLQKFP